MNNRLAVFLHGLGCTSRNWAAAETEMQGWDVWTPDFRCGVLMQAGFVISEIDRYRAKAGPDARVLIAGHSMGGATAILAAQDLEADGVVSCLSVEGNLTGEDCGLLSRALANEAEISPGLPTFPEFGWEDWRSEELRSAARSLVRWSDDGGLLRAWLRLDRTLYVCGDQATTARSDVFPRRAIAGAGHWPMLDKPEEFWDTVREFADE